MARLEHGAGKNPIQMESKGELTFYAHHSTPDSMPPEQSGKILLTIGIGLCIVGILLWKFGDRLKWIGHLPGDLTYEGSQFRFYFPFTTLLLLNGIFWLLVKIKDWLSKD